MNTKKIAFLCGYFPDEIKRDIEKRSRGIIQYAAHALQKSIISGIDQHVSDLSIINLPYVGSYPIRYKSPRLKESHFSHRDGACDVNAGFNNISIYKYFSRYINAKKQLTIWARNNEGKKIVLVYAMHTPFVKAAIEIKQLIYDVAVCLIVPDLPEHMGGKRKGLYRFLRASEKRMLNNYLPLVNGFVLLTKYMAEVINIGRRPWVCIEGIYDEPGMPIKEQNIYDKQKIVMYSGNLTIKYGIQNLLDAFIKTDKKDYQLWICGEGEARSLVKKRAKSDSRIKYFGQLAREEVLALQKEATVLVNPRTGNGEYTRYSFPSKIMEYYASGTPTIMHRLPGIPEEYFKYCFIAEQENAEGLLRVIDAVFEMKAADLKKAGECARKFILENKNAKIQTGKIIEMIEHL